MFGTNCRLAGDWYMWRLVQKYKITWMCIRVSLVLYNPSCRLSSPSDCPSHFDFIEGLCLVEVNAPILHARCLVKVDRTDPVQAPSSTTKNNNSDLFERIEKILVGTCANYNIRATNLPLIFEKILSYFWRFFGRHNFILRSVIVNKTFTCKCVRIQVIYLLLN